ncbi:MAG: hypothetical protein K9K66_09990 [Desulfarculaceae bacterium]|nr:hypothetical protein [Desulfarculaceae bacterium]MCF8073739.1 hypothetical protein [Desulfarculaceae bacterium]MCF8101980.1 hypothetical protein [Desulfarculaceae bacterium]MCF8115950.1 hypothetical protein [Desulfarculaceae bacterium]
MVEHSDLPTRAMISWLVYEGNKLGGASGQQAAVLALHWEAANLGQRLIAPPPVLPDHHLVFH